MAEDGGSPPKSATATTTINILRNLNVPEFSPKSYNVTVFETDQVGRIITTVTATDADQIVSIPVLFLKKTRIKLILTFLNLTVFMIISS